MPDRKPGSDSAAGAAASAIHAGRVVGLLEDDPDQAAIFVHWLEESGYDVRWFRSAVDFRRRLGVEAIDLLLLDWMLPDGSGLDVIAWIRASPTAMLPVIFLTARDSEEDLVRGLACGGDDYVTKPAKRRELLARVDAALRRSGAVGQQTMVFPPYTIDTDRRRVSIGGSEIELTQREFDLAAFLFRRQGRIVGRSALLEYVWNLSSAVSTRTVDTHVSRLRKKLGLNGDHGWRLTAVYQHGYRLERV